MLYKIVKETKQNINKIQKYTEKRPSLCWDVLSTQSDHGRGGSREQKRNITKFRWLTTPKSNNFKWLGFVLSVGTWDAISVPFESTWSKKEYINLRTMREQREISTLTFTRLQFSVLRQTEETEPFWTLKLADICFQTNSLTNYALTSCQLYINSTVKSVTGPSVADKKTWWISRLYPPYLQSMLRLKSAVLQTHPPYGSLPKPLSY